MTIYENVERYFCFLLLTPLNFVSCPTFCSLHAVTSSVIYYSTHTHTQKNVIYLLHSALCYSLSLDVLDEYYNDVNSPTLKNIHHWIELIHLNA